MDDDRSIGRFNQRDEESRDDCVNLLSVGSRLEDIVDVINIL